MKKICTFLLIMTMGFSLIACGKKASDEAGSAEAVAQVEITNAEEAADKGEDANNTEAAGDSSKDSSAEEKSTDAAVDDSSKDSAVAEKSTEAASKEAGTTEKSTEAVSSDANPDAAAKDAEKEEQAAEEAPAQTPEETPKAPQTLGYGRIIFTGDSRTVDMFSADVDEIYGGVYNNIPVFCRDGCKFQYMVDAINSYGLDNFDTLVTWMGCNDFGNFSQYGPYYDQLLAAGKQIVVCTVGPTQDEYLLDDMDWYYYPNSNQINYNNALVSWANSRGVKVIDMYSYINNSSTVTVNQQDGIHYDPKPTTELWNYIIANLK